MLAYLPAVSQPCDLKRDSEGIRVYTCKSELEKFKSLRAEFELTNINKNELRVFLWNVRNYTTWQYNVVQAYAMDSVGENNLSYRALIDAPWPVENRETIVRMKVAETDTAMHITINEIAHEAPVPDNFVRVPFFRAQWVIVPKGNVLHVTYSLRIDPGGYVPAWLVNIAMADGPFQSFKNLKAQLNPK